MTGTAITNTIRKLRFERNEMTQQDLAERVGVTRQTINAMELGKYSPSLEVAFRIAAVLGASLEDVFSYHGSAAAPRGDSRCEARRRLDAACYERGGRWRLYCRPSSRAAGARSRKRRGPVSFRCVRRWTLLFPREWPCSPRFRRAECATARVVIHVGDIMWQRCTDAAYHEHREPLSALATRSSTRPAITSGWTASISPRRIRWTVSRACGPRSSRRPLAAWGPRRSRSSPNPPTPSTPSSSRTYVGRTAVCCSQRSTS